MGCGASSKSPKDDVGQPTGPEKDPEPAVATWATKTDAHNNLFDTPSSDTNAVASNAGPNRNEPMRISDADDESEIEIIYEGKSKQATGNKNPYVSAANGQEGPEEPMDMSDAGESKPSKEILSKRQQEEAAKLAEQRKRFDNQRYQRELGASNASTAPSSTGGSNGNNTAISPKEPRQEPHQVMGINFTEVRKGQEDPFLHGLPPGALGDTPRADVPPPLKPCNKHDIFDDDEELFMQEILETCG